MSRRPTNNTNPFADDYKDPEEGMEKTDAEIAAEAAKAQQELEDAARRALWIKELERKRSLRKEGVGGRARLNSSATTTEAISPEVIQQRMEEEMRKQAELQARALEAEATRLRNMSHTSSDSDKTLHASSGSPTPHASAFNSNPGSRFPSSTSTSNLFSGARRGSAASALAAVGEEDSHELPPAGRNNSTSLASTRLGSNLSQAGGVSSVPGSAPAAPPRPQRDLRQQKTLTGFMKDLFNPKPGNDGGRGGA